MRPDRPAAVSVFAALRSRRFVFPRAPGLEMADLEHHPYIHESSTLRFAVPRETNRTEHDPQVSQISRAKHRNSREARSSSGWLAAYLSPSPRDATLGERVSGATPALFRHEQSGGKVGSLPDHFSALPRPTARHAVCTSMSQQFRSPLGDFNGDGDGYVCLSRTRHLSRARKASNLFPA